MPSTPKGCGSGTSAVRIGATSGRSSRRAKRAGVGTVYIKAGDASTTWSQFSSSLVSALHAGGLRVCGWQFVYGDAPIEEAKVGAAAVARGADCLIIDAEGHYEGKYASADRYIRKLRPQVGPDYPLSLAPLPLRRLPPGLSLLGVPRSRGRPVQPAADVLEDDRDQRRAACTRIPISTTASTSGRSSHRADLSSPAAADQAVPTVRARLRRPRRELVVMAGNHRARMGRARQEGEAHRGLSTNTQLPLLRKGSRGDLVVWAQQHLLGGRAEPASRHRTLQGPDLQRCARLPAAERASTPTAGSGPPPGASCSSTPRCESHGELAARPRGRVR